MKRINSISLVTQILLMKVIEHLERDITTNLLLQKILHANGKRCCHLQSDDANEMIYLVGVLEEVKENSNYIKA